MVSWERSLFWLWFVGAVGWTAVSTYYVYVETKGFTLHQTPVEWATYLLLWTIPPLFTYAVYLSVVWFGRHDLANNGRNHS